MSAAASIADAQWLKDESLQRLLSVLSREGEEARIAGGSVRNTLLGEPVSDIDIATTTQPEDTTRRAEAAGFKVRPTGIEHGTVTVIAAGAAYEVTTLRADIDTDGRRAKVIFGRDWKQDVERRDFTINALYAEADGRVIDLVGGLHDLKTRRIRFIGDAEARIREDFLRILRFFRFFARYGAGRPDADGLKACAKLKEGLAQLSAERVWAELKKLLSSPDPSRALLWMRQASVLTAVLPESEKWGIDAIHGLIRAEQELGWPPDPVLRLQAMIPPHAARAKELAGRLKFSGVEADRLLAWTATENVAPDLLESEFAKKLYRGDRQGHDDRLRLALASARNRAFAEDGAPIDADGHARLLSFLESWRAPAFPLGGGDLVEMGMKEGPALGAALKELEDAWIQSGFTLVRGALLARAADRLKV